MACSTNLRFLGTRNGSNRRLELELRAPQGQQFSLWPCHPPPGEGTRPTSPEKPPSCRPGALTRLPHLVQNENCCRRVVHFEATLWERQKPEAGGQRTGEKLKRWCAEN